MKEDGGSAPRCCVRLNMQIGNVAQYVYSGMNTARVLAVVLDRCTHNDGLRENPLKLWLRRSRLNGEDNLAVRDHWVSDGGMRCPNALVQFEDIGSDVASKVLKLLGRHLYATVVMFKEDMQCTGCVAIERRLASMCARDKEMGDLAHEVIVRVGIRSAGFAVCNEFIDAVVNGVDVSHQTVPKNVYVLPQD